LGGKIGQKTIWVLLVGDLVFKKRSNGLAARRDKLSRRQNAKAEEKETHTHTDAEREREREQRAEREEGEGGAECQLVE
jgi:hypothetical protein